MIEKLTNGIKRIAKRKVSTKKMGLLKKIGCFSRINWVRGLKEERGMVFGKTKTPFDLILQNNGAKNGDFILVNLVHGSTPPTNFTNFSLDKLYKKAIIRIFNPEGELKTTLKFYKQKKNVAKFYEPPGKWIGDKTKIN
ncbi:MAG: hypothetical protein WC290_00990 [archaeon]|jgi:predicted ribonuclease toxin of YeeF-YezG toxin-antitoxin module|nr:hypothetical protein [archaeon]